VELELTLAGLQALAHSHAAKRISRSAHDDQVMRMTRHM
jgi:hypothetical protein